MNLADDLGNDLAMAFLVEKKFSKKLDAKESLALIRKIRETLRLSQIENGDGEISPTTKIAVSRGN
jgi:hypothetical protein